MDKIKVGNPYRYVYGGPGPDVTVVVVLSIENGLALVWDALFEMYVKDVEVKNLWEPDKWFEWEQKKIKIANLFLKKNSGEKK